MTESSRLDVTVLELNTPHNTLH